MPSSKHTQRNDHAAPSKGAPSHQSQPSIDGFASDAAPISEAASGPVLGGARLSPGDVARLQRTLGNHALSGLLGASATLSAGAPSRPAGGNPAEAQRLFGSNEVQPLFGLGTFNPWLRQHAEAEGKTGLMGFYERLTPAQQLEALRIMLKANPTGLTLKQAKSKATGILGRKVEWDAFSEGIRAASVQGPAGSGGSAVDTAQKGLLAASGTAGTAQFLGQTGALASAGQAIAPAMDVIGQVAPGLGIVGGAIGMAEHWGRMGGVEGGRTGEQEFVANANFTHQGFDMYRQGATAATAAIKLGAAGSLAAATMATGILAIPAGAVGVLAGVSGAMAHSERAGQIDQIAAAATGRGDTRLANAAALGAGTQRIQTAVSAATAAKGAALIVGGALLLATNPVGWMVLGGAAVIGGIGAIYKLVKKSRRKTQVVDKELGIDALPSARREARRNELLQNMGFNTVDQFYAAYIATTAQYLFESGVMGGDLAARDLMTNMGLQVVAGQKPQPAAIMDALQNG